MDSAAARWKRPWEEESHAQQPLPRLHSHHPPDRCDCSPPLGDRTLPAVHEDPGPPQPWPFQARAHLYLAESQQSNKRRRPLPDRISLPSPHSSRPSADSAGFRGSGEDHDDSAPMPASEHGRQQLPPASPASPAMSSAHFDARGFLPAVLPQGESACCGASCSGLPCTRRRALISDLVAEVDTLNAGIQRVVLQTNSQPRLHSSGVSRLGTDQALAFAVDLLRTNVASLRGLTSTLSLSSGAGAERHSAFTAAATAEIRDVMERRFDPVSNQEILLFPPRPASGGDRDLPRTIPLPGAHEDVRRSFQGSRDPLSPRHSPSGAHPVSNGNAYTRHPSPTHTQPPPYRMLPSPSSLNIPPPSTILSLASPSPSLLPQPPSSSAAHTAHLQDLQHQISLKTLAQQTLRQEYDALLSKLDRQRTKCATLEKKFEVTDVEINSLTTEKEELDAKVAALEQQVEELREQRDDARRREVQTGQQYRSIVEMASRLQGMAAEEKRKWMQEREGLLNALGWNDDDDTAGAEGGQSSGQADAGRTLKPPTASATLSSGLGNPTTRGIMLEAPNIPLSQHPKQHGPPAAATAATSQVIAALRVEVAQLRSRTQALEAALTSVYDQGMVMEETSQAVVDAGRKMREMAREAIGDK